MNDDLVKRLKKWADGEAMAAYGEHLVDHPDEHEGSQISELIDTLTDRVEELERERDKAMKWAQEQHLAADRYAARIEELEAEIVRLRSHLQWIHDGAHTRGHALPDIKERASIALGEGEDR